MNCAVGRKGKTCYSLESLKKIALAYNQKLMTESKHRTVNMNPIKLSSDSGEIYEQLRQRLKDFCNDNEKCWKDLDFVKSLDDLEIEKFTFLPDAPQGRYAWLSTIDIEDALNQYSKLHNDFHFLGAVPMDFDDLPVLGIKNLNFLELYKNGTKRIGIVFNTDEHYKPGQHWVSAFVDLHKKQAYFFDSVGSKPDQRVIAFLARAVKNIMKIHKCTFDDVDIMYNNVQHQQGDTECGVYSINFIRRIINGEAFRDIIREVMTDEKMNECRKVYFDTVNKSKKSRRSS